MPKTDKSYRELQAELDDIMLKLQDGELDVDQAVKLYEQGLAVVKQLEAMLAAAESKVAKLKTSVSED